MTCSRCRKPRNTAFPTKFLCAKCELVLRKRGEKFKPRLTINGTVITAAELPRKEARILFKALVTR